MKRHNVHLVINTIIKYGPISRTELRDRVGLTAATVINITNDLLERNILLQEGLAAASSKGRKALMLNVNPTAFYTLGVSLSTRRLRVGLANFQGQIVDHVDVTIRNTITPEEAVDLIQQNVQMLVEKHQVPTEKLVGVGGGGTRPPGYPHGTDHRTAGSAQLAQCAVAEAAGRAAAAAGAGGQ